MASGPKRARLAPVYSWFTEGFDTADLQEAKARLQALSIAAPAQDARIPTVLEAVTFWNRQFADIGTPFRLGDVTQATDTLPADYLRRLSAAVLRREPQVDVSERVWRNVTRHSY
jgi:hypothetical protein